MYDERRVLYTLHFPLLRNQTALVMAPRWNHVMSLHYIDEGAISPCLQSGCDRKTQNAWYFTGSEHDLTRFNKIAT